MKKTLVLGVSTAIATTVLLSGCTFDKDYRDVPALYGPVPDDRIEEEVEPEEDIEQPVDEQPVVVAYGVIPRG